MNSPEIKFKNILKEIRLYESGPAVDGMERLGLKYHKILGVSLIDLKKIAKKYYPNHKLAKLLREKNFRETKILSLMIDDSEKITDNYLNETLQQITTQELAEQIVLNILEKHEKYYSKANEFIYSENEFLISTGFVFYSRIAIINKNISDDFFEYFFERGVELSENNSINIRKSIARAFRQTALRNNKLKKKVLNTMLLIKNKKNKNADLVYEEVVPLIVY